MTDITGWIGRAEELMGFLGAANADRDPEGKFIVSGNITSFLGMGDEFVVGADAVYYYGGKPVPLAYNLNITGVGLKISVL